MKIRKSLFLLIVTSTLVISAYLSGWVRLNYPSLEEYPHQGLDVSHHQGKIDWQNVPKERVQFVYIKASEGGDWTDKRFLENWSGARSAGLQVGAYHFFTLCREGRIQAQNFLSRVPEDDKALPPVIDLEYVGNCAERPAKEEFIASLDDFVAMLKAKPVLYTTHAFYDDYLAGTVYEDFPLWIRDVVFEPDRAKYPSMVMWQYADNARVEGIDGPVDLNVLYKK